MYEIRINNIKLIHILISSGKIFHQACLIVNNCCQIYKLYDNTPIFLNIYYLIFLKKNYPH